MGVLLDHFACAGVRLEVLGDDLIKARGPLTDPLRNLIRANRAALVGELTVARHSAWRVAIPGREPFNVRVVPASTEDEMRVQYPGAKVEAA